jgi:hypothetical protein
MSGVRSTVPPYVRSPEYCTSVFRNIIRENGRGGHRGVNWTFAQYGNVPRFQPHGRGVTPGVTPSAPMALGSPSSLGSGHGSFGGLHPLDAHVAVTVIQRHPPPSSKSQYGWGRSIGTVQTVRYGMDLGTVSTVHTAWPQTANEGRHFELRLPPHGRIHHTRSPHQSWDLPAVEVANGGAQARGMEFHHRSSPDAIAELSR